MNYLTKDDLIEINRLVIAAAQEGTVGVADPHGLETIVQQPSQQFFGREAYPNIWLKAAFLLQKITKKPVFFDGNKRTAFMATAFFLDLNNYSLKVSAQDGQDLVMETTLSADTEEQMVKIALFIKENSTLITR
ncbi:type II toxin-antitoxin system death-on-curing family toxin [Lentilactobacillus parafarraginis]|jgi:death-on-curing protein|uniref:Fido domain-containing protein n=2 Tax=Lentilactobacillus parafarraginis TaxID=390842 RepID=A0A0R1YGC3_9LACO|nr:type II toxin-antitoxin system death-on-curing family toxin [Lentilactobacillus parafarraginis]KRM41346.1 hypothetical protein FD47_GL002505 [Lentilactobacillus parafarraginis DSM 18390 = JCM 14109]TLQ21189.1 type II toxin-antitoxin system death-on-curing family toxin [Lentilactobacillus parafarraginis]